MRDILLTAFRTLAEVIYPARCIYCRRIGSAFCQTCRAQAQPVGDAICVRCGEPTTVRCTCHACQKTPPGPLRAMRGAVFYGSPVAFAIHGLKYRQMTHLAQPLASYLSAYLDAHPLPIDCLTPVPLHPERQTARGYNQSELLARAVGRERRLPVRNDLIERKRHTPPQVHLNREQRLQNMKDAFAALRPGALHGETVLLIDDVCTTGATMRACAEALRVAGAGEVYALAIARARTQRQPDAWERGLSPAQVFVAWDELTNMGSRG